MRPTPLIEDILADLRPAAVRLAAQRLRRRRVRRTATLGVLAGGGLASAAVGAVVLLGAPAPDSVKRDLRAVDDGMPADLRRNPDVEGARAVAIAGNATVYFARLADGGYCAELVTGGRARGAVCSSEAESAATKIGVTVPFTDPVTASSPITVSGHVSVAGASGVQLVYPDGGTGEARLSAERFYVAEVPDEHLAAVHARGLLLIAHSSDGKPLAQRAVPHGALTPPTEAQRPKDPIEIDTLSDGRDLTKLLGVRGTVQIEGAVQVRLRYPDGHVDVVDLENRHYRINIRPEHQGDFEHQAGAIEALDAKGVKIGQRPVASVAWWHRRNGG